MTVVSEVSVPILISAALAERDVVLPLRLCEDEVGVILDAAGVAVITIDVYNERPDDTVMEIAGLVVLAVNAAATSRVVRAR